MQMPTTQAALRPQPALTELLDMQTGEAPKKDEDGAGQISGSPLSDSRAARSGEGHSGVSDFRQDAIGAKYTAAEVPDGWSEAMMGLGIATGAPFGAFGAAMEHLFGSNPMGVVGPSNPTVRTSTNASYKTAMEQASATNAEKRAEQQARDSRSEIRDIYGQDADKVIDSGGSVTGSGGTGPAPDGGSGGSSPGGDRDSGSTGGETGGTARGDSSPGGIGGY
jgi:hypothetical protein